MDKLSFMILVTFEAKTSVLELAIQIVVPILVAFVAAYFVVKQMQQMDKFRTSDRKADAIIALTNLLDERASYATRKIGMTPGGYSPHEEYSQNSHYIRALALLDKGNEVVAKWVNAESLRMLKLAEAELKKDPVSGTSRHKTYLEIYGIGSAAMGALIDWQDGSTNIKWFIEREPRFAD